MRKFVSDEVKNDALLLSRLLASPFHRFPASLSLLRVKKYITIKTNYKGCLVVKYNLLWYKKSVQNSLFNKIRRKA